jgi:hypothetical protein
MSCHIRIEFFKILDNSRLTTFEFRIPTSSGRVISIMSRRAQHHRRGARGGDASRFVWVNPYSQPEEQTPVKERTSGHKPAPVVRRGYAAPVKAVRGRENVANQDSDKRDAKKAKQIRLHWAFTNRFAVHPLLVVSVCDALNLGMNPV